MKITLTSLAFVVITLVASAASADPLTLATVGNVDPLISSTTLPNSADATEQNWVASVVGIPAGQVTYDKILNSGGSNWQQVDGTTNLFAFELKTNIPFFVVKLGNGAPNSHYLFANLGNTAYAVVDFNVFGMEGDPVIGKISHVGGADFEGGGEGSTGGQTTPVPEPASLALLGLGLAGVRAAVRKRRTA